MSYRKLAAHCHALCVGGLAIAASLATTASWADDKPAKIDAAWTQINAQPASFMGRELRPSCSGLPGTDPSYHFWTKRGKDHKKVAVFFEGGGACWNTLTCFGNPAQQLLPTFKPFIGADQDPRTAGGIFDLDNPHNPVRDWNFVYVPYCTGDVHLGSHDTLYPVAPGVSLPIRHRGFDNFLTVLKWMTENLDEPKQILVTGSSAGGYGATGAFPFIHDAFPDARTHLLADGSNGVTPPPWEVIRNTSWNLQLAPQIFANETPTITFQNILKLTMDFYPHSKFGQYTTDWDQVQRDFLSLMRLSIGQPLPAGAVCREWNTRMESDLGFAQASPNYWNYIGAGEVHTILRSDAVYTETSAGRPFTHWLKGLVSNEGGDDDHGGPKWRRLSCAGDCSPPPECVQ